MCRTLNHKSRSLGILMTDSANDIGLSAPTIGGLEKYHCSCVQMPGRSMVEGISEISKSYTHFFGKPQSCAYDPLHTTWKATKNSPSLPFTWCNPCLISLGSHRFVAYVNELEFWKHEELRACLTKEAIFLDSPPTLY